MSHRLAIAQAYEQALFAGRMDEVGGYFTDDIIYWVAGAPPIGGEWRGRGQVLHAFANRSHEARLSIELISGSLMLPSFSTRIALGAEIARPSLIPSGPPRQRAVRCCLPAVLSRVAACRR